MNRVASVSFVLASLVVGVAAVGGPLNPPAGPVTSSYKTLTEVEPRIAINATNTPGNATNVFVISQSGSYYLTGNVQGVSGKNGILIPAGVDNVTIDLNGFHLQGVAGSLTGIQLPGFSNNITVRNGFIDGWGSDGINLLRSNGGRIENVTLSNNGGFGMRVGSNYTVSETSAWGNAGTGISVGTSSIVTNCVSTGNTNGIVIGNNSTVRHSVASENGTDGFVCSSGCFVLNNSAAGNGASSTNGAGLYVTGGDNRIEGNNFTGADYGLQINVAGNVVMRNTASGNGMNWSIVAGNAVAPIVQATTNSNAIAGNTYTGNLGSTDANANFTY